MATNYPGGLDSFTNPGAGDALNSPSHAGQHANANDAIEAVQTELGATPSGSESTVAARLDKIEDGTRLGANSVGATQLADNAVDTNAIADSAVTSAKIADGTIVNADINASAAIAKTKVAGYYEGTAVPNGSQTGNPGDLYYQSSTAATATGTLLWRKATDTGTTGWVAEGALADTGWRDISASFTGGYTSGAALVRRVGQTVQVRATSGLSPTLTNGDWNTIVNLAAGFRPYVNVDPVVWNAGFAGDLRRAYVSTAGDVRLMGAGATVAAMTLHAEFTTTASWPTTLPGSAA